MRQYGSAVAQPVDMGPRILARLINGAVLVVPYLMLAFAQESIIALLVIVVLLAVGVLQLSLIVTKSTTIGGHAMKIVYLNTDTGQEAKGKLFARLFVTSLISGVTFGLADIALLITYREGQHWLDRSMGTVGVLRTSVSRSGFVGPGVMAGPAPSVGPAVGSQQGFVQQGAPRAPQGGVTPVSLPPTMAPAAPVWPPAPPAPAPVATPPVAAPASDQAPFVPPAVGTPSATPFSGTTQAEPTTAPSTNPWSIGAHQATPAPASQPQSATFTPPGQSPLPPAPSPVPMPPTPKGGAGMLDDATVLDADVSPAIAVVLDDGQVISLESPVILGRNPIAPDSHPGARCVTLVDDSKRMSKTHLIVEAISGSVVVTDAGAANGVTVEVAGVSERLTPLAPRTLGSDDIVHVGSRTLRVSA